MIEKVKNFLKILLRFFQPPEIKEEIVDKHRYFSRKELLMGRDIEYPLSEELEANLDKLLEAINKFRELYGKPLIISSGYRPGHYNKAAGGASRSPHLTCEAVDFRDVDGKLAEFSIKCDADGLLKKWGLWLEDPSKTKGWVHLDIRDRGNRKSNIFIP